MKHLYYSDLPEPESLDETALLFIDTPMCDIDICEQRIQPFLSMCQIIAPWRSSSPKWTSSAAVILQDRLDEDHVGVVVPTNEQVDFFLWAQEQEFRPIVLPPHPRRSFERRLLDLSIPHMIRDTTWIHLMGCDWDPTGDFPGIYTNTLEELPHVE